MPTAAARENAVEIVVEGLEIGLVDGDEPARRRAAEILRQGAEKISDRPLHEDEEMVDRFGLEPRVEPQPGGIDEMMERDDRLQPVRAAIGDPLRVTVERALVERRRLRASGSSPSLLPSTVDGCTRAHSMLMRKALRPMSRQRPKSSCASVQKSAVRPEGTTSPLLLRPGPVVERLAGPVVAALRLITRRGHAPEKIAARMGDLPLGRPLGGQIGFASLLDRRKTVRMAR